MSANNAIVVVDEQDGTFSVWLDSCVDNPFPLSASKILEATDELTAMRFALDYGKDDPWFICEYGVSRIQGPIARLQLEAEACAMEQGWT